MFSYAIFPVFRSSVYQFLLSFNQPRSFCCRLLNFFFLSLRVIFFLTSIYVQSEFCVQRSRDLAFLSRIHHVANERADDRADGEPRRSQFDYVVEGVCARSPRESSP